MQNPPTIHYNNKGYEATYNPASDTCTVVIRGYYDVDGNAVERGWPTHPNDKPLWNLIVETSCAKLANKGGVDDRIAFKQTSRIRDVFHDALADRRDLFGAPIFRHKPTDDTERRFFAAAYDAAQKVRANSTILGVDKLVFSLNPSLFANIDCFARDKAGVFWLMVYSEDNVVPSWFSRYLPLAAYTLEAGGYVPATATVHLGVWSILPAGPRFMQIFNDRIAARNIIIEHLFEPPF